MHGSTLIILVSLDWLSGSVGDCTVSAGVYGGGRRCTVEGDSRGKVEGMGSGDLYPNERRTGGTPITITGPVYLSLIHI